MALTLKVSIDIIREEQAGRVASCIFDRAHGIISFGFLPFLHSLFLIRTLSFQYFTSVIFLGGPLPDETSGFAGV